MKVFALVALLLSVNVMWGQKTYKLVTSATDLTAGSKYIIVNGATASTSAAAVGYQASNNRPQAAVTIVNTSGTISLTTTPATLNTETSKVFEFTLGGSSNAWTFNDAANNGYLFAAGAASSGNNYLRTQTNSDANGQWTITFVNNAANMVANGSNLAKYLRFNSNIFGCYSASSYTTYSVVYLYKELITYTVGYNANTGAGTAPVSGNYQPNTSFTTATQGALTKSGYNFTGWNTAADGSGTSYAANTAYTMPAANLTLYAQWIENNTPTISTSGTLSSVSTTYGTASATPTSFTVSGINLTAPITLTAPAGYELVVSPATDYATTTSFTPAANTNYTVNVRLAATTAVGSYVGNITLTSTGATSVNVATTSSAVTAKTLTINGLTGINKEYDSTLAATVSGSPVLSATANSDVIILNSTSASYAFETKTIGSNKTIIVNGYSISGANISNYTLTQPSVRANITAKTVTINGVIASDKTYDGTTSATISGGTVNGAITGDVVSVATSGTFAQVNAGNNINVTISLTGADATNYYLAPTTVHANIIKATPVITVSTITVVLNGTYSLPGTAITSTSNGAFTYTSSAPATASITDGNTLHGLTGGSTTLLINQAESTNYAAASQTANIIVTTIADGTYRTLTGGKWPGTGTGFATWERFTNGGWNNTAPTSGAADPIIIRHAVITGNTFTSTASSGLGRNITVENGGSFTSAHNGTIKSLVVKNGGTFILSDNTPAVLSSTTSNLIVENGGKLVISRDVMTSNDAFWNGAENFMDGSIVEIQSWNASANQQGDKFVQNPSTISPNSSGSIFGNLTLSGSSTGVFKIVDDRQTVKLTSGNLTIARNGSLVTNLTNNSSSVTIGGNIIITSGILNIGASYAPIVTVEGSVNANGGTLNLYSTSNSNTGMFSTLEIKGGLYTATGSVLISSDDDSKISFVGNNEQAIQINGTLNARTDFEVASGANVKLPQNLLLTNDTNNFTILSGGTLNAQTYAITGSGIFTSNESSTITTSNTGGIVSTITAATKTFGAGTNYTFNSATSAPFPLSTIGNPGIITTNANVTLNRNITSQGSIVINTGTFNLDTFTIDRNTAGGSISIATDATLKIGGTNGFPSNYNTLTFNPNSNVEYGGQAQQVRNLSAEYKNVVLSGTGAKSFVNGTVVGNNLTLQNGPTVTIPANTTITVGNSLVNNASAESFTINDNGALLQTGTGTNTGAVIVLKNANPLYRLDYTMWAAPVENQKLTDFSPATELNRFFEYKYAINSATGLPVEGYWPVNPALPFDAAKGYLIRMPASDSTPGYNNNTSTLNFTGHFAGKPHTGTYNTAASNQGYRYTAVGNPYPSPIGVQEFFAQNSDVIEPSTPIYLWRKRNNSQSASYAKLTLAQYVANSGSGNASTPTGGQDQAVYFPLNGGADYRIAPGQGFIIKAKAGAGQVTFTNSMRKAAPTTGGQAFLRTGQTPASRLWINLTDANGGFSQSGVAYLAEGTTGLDYGYDGKQIIETGIPTLYSVVENTPLAIQARPEFTPSDVVPMGYRAHAAGSLTISIDHTDGLFETGQNIYLKDKTMGITRNISGSDYTFTTEAGTFDDRFELVYTNTALGTDNPVITADNVIVYKNGEAISINAGATRIKDVTVFDIRGRKLYGQQNVNNTETVINGLTVQSQVLIVEIATEKGIVSKKIIF